MEGWQVKIFADYRLIPPPVWRDVALFRSAFQQKTWFDAVPHPGELLLICAMLHDKFKAILPVFIIANRRHYYHNPYDILAGDKERNFLASYPERYAAIRQAGPDSWFPCAVTASPFGYRGGVICADPENIPLQVYHAIISKARALFAEKKIRVAAFYYLNSKDDRCWLEALREANIKVTLAGADCTLPLKWESLDAFFQSLGSHRKTRARAEFRKLRDSDSVHWVKRTGWKHDEESLIHQVVELFAGTQRKHGHDPKETAWYAGLIQNLSADRILFTGESRDIVRSALLVFRKGEMLYPKFYGDVNTRGDYFFLCYYRLIQEGILNGAACIEFGGGSHKSKILRGATLRPLFMGIESFDNNLSSLLEEYLPFYEKAKRDHFSSLWNQYAGAATPRDPFWNINRLLPSNPEQ